MLENMNGFLFKRADKHNIQISEKHDSTRAKKTSNEREINGFVFRIGRSTIGNKNVELGGERCNNNVKGYDQYARMTVHKDKIFDIKDKGDVKQSDGTNSKINGDSRKKFKNNVRNAKTTIKNANVDVTDKQSRDINTNNRFNEHINGIAIDNPNILDNYVNREPKKQVKGIRKTKDMIVNKSVERNINSKNNCITNKILTENNVKNENIKNNISANRKIQPNISNTYKCITQNNNCDNCNNKTLASASVLNHGVTFVKDQIVTKNKLSFEFKKMSISHKDKNNCIEKINTENNNKKYYTYDNNKQCTNDEKVTDFYLPKKINIDKNNFDNLKLIKNNIKNNDKEFNTVMHENNNRLNCKPNEIEILDDDTTNLVNLEINTIKNFENENLLHKYNDNINNNHTKIIKDPIKNNVTLNELKTPIKGMTLTKIKEPTPFRFDKNDFLMDIKTPKKSIFYNDAFLLNSRNNKKLSHYITEKNDDNKENKKDDNVIININNRNNVQKNVKVEDKKISRIEELNLFDQNANILKTNDFFDKKNKIERNNLNNNNVNNYNLTSSMKNAQNTPYEIVKKKEFSIPNNLSKEQQIKYLLDEILDNIEKECFTFDKENNINNKAEIRNVIKNYKYEDPYLKLENDFIKYINEYKNEIDEINNEMSKWKNIKQDVLQENMIYVDDRILEYDLEIKEIIKKEEENKIMVYNNFVEEMNSNFQSVKIYKEKMNVYFNSIDKEIKSIKNNVFNRIECKNKIDPVALCIALSKI